MLGDITILEQNNSGGRGGRVYNVAASTNLIYAGEPVKHAPGAIVASSADTNTPVVATDFYGGVALTTSTNTSAAAGTVEVLPINSGVTFLIAPKVAASFDTQAEYDALVEKRVLLDLTAGTYTILAADGSTNGCVIQPLDIAKYPGKVAFAFRAGVSDLT